MKKRDGKEVEVIVEKVSEEEIDEKEIEENMAISKKE